MCTPSSRVDEDLGNDVLVPDLAGWRRERLPLLRNPSAADVLPHDPDPGYGRYRRSRWAKITSSKTRARRWRQWTEAEAREVLAEFVAGDESAAAFARRKGCSVARVRYWMKRLASSAVPEFVAVPLPVPTSPAESGHWIEIDRGRVVVRVGGGLDVEHVARLVGSIARQVGGAC